MDGGKALGLWAVQPARKRATFADLLSLPPEVRAEIVDGVIVTPPPPLPEHGRAQRSVASFIGKPYDDDDGRGGPGGWWILVEVDVELGAHVVRPDVAGWRRERLPRPWGVRPLTVAPDWVCEVVSPAKPAHDRVLKRRIYADHGVAYYWIVDPQARTLEALRLDAATRAWIEVGAYDEESVARIAPFDGIELEVGRVFAPQG